MNKCDRIQNEFNNLVNLYKEKNQNYGNSFEHTINLLGISAGLVPLINKVDRLVSLIQNGGNKFESIEDTCRDLINYTAMFLIEYQDFSQAKEKTGDCDGDRIKNQWESYCKKQIREGEEKRTCKII